MREVTKPHGRRMPVTGDKGICTVYCSTRHNKRYELLVKFQNDRAVIGAKRIALDNPVGETNGTKPTSLGGIYELTNGVTWDCMHCQNNKVFICSCGCMCCRKSGTDIVCPQCSTKVLKEDISHTDRINATEKKAGRKALGQSTSSGLLPLAGRK